MTESAIVLDLAAPVATVTIHRPAKRNALTRAMLTELRLALAEIERAADMRVVVLRGSGDAFCSGLDLDEMLRERECTGTVEHRLFEEVLDSLGSLRHPTIAMIQGVALAGGCELALHCDLRTASPDARLGMPLARVGIVVPFTLARRLYAVAGLTTASDMLISGQALGGERAHAVGLVSRLVPSDRLVEETYRLASRVAGHAPLAVREMKRALWGLTSRMDSQLDGAFDEVRNAVSRSQDTLEGLRAFVERRPPIFCEQ